jgi:hypothetical protein
MARSSAARITFVIAAVATVCLMGDTAAAQCAMCRRALQSPEGQQLAAALRSGILFLLAAPFTVFAVVATLAVRRFMITGDDQADGRAGRSPGAQVELPPHR